jgi:hypothetical protein
MGWLIAGSVAVLTCHWILRGGPLACVDGLHCAGVPTAAQGCQQMPKESASRDNTQLSGCAIVNGNHNSPVGCWAAQTPPSGPGSGGWRTGGPPGTAGRPMHDILHNRLQYHSMRQLTRKRLFSLPSQVQIPKSQRPSWASLVKPPWPRPLRLGQQQLLLPCPRYPPGCGTP